MRVCIIMALIATGAGCRKDGDEVAATIKWSCARVHQTGPAIATPECLTKMQQENDPALKHYKAVPQMENGRIVQYALIQRQNAD